MSRIASLGMYDLPHLKSANDRLWTAIAVRLREAGLPGVPDGLDRSRPVEEIWDDPQLLLAQTCGYPLTTKWRGRLTYVTTPVYDCLDAPGHRHRSRFVVRRTDDAAVLGDLLGRRAAINDQLSSTGMNLLRRAVAPLNVGGRFFSSVVVTGSHASSIDAVIKGVADVASIDEVTFDHLARQEPARARLTRTIGWSLPVPNLPFVTGADTEPRIVDLLKQAIDESILTEDAAAKMLSLRSTMDIGIGSYGLITSIEAAAQELGYPVMS